MLKFNPRNLARRPAPPDVRVDCDGEPFAARNSETDGH